MWGSEGEDMAARRTNWTYGTVKNVSEPSPISKIREHLRDVVKIWRHGRNEVASGEISENHARPASVDTQYQMDDANRINRGGNSDTGTWDFFDIPPATLYIIGGVVGGVGVCAIIYFLVKCYLNQDNNNDTEFHTRMPNSAERRGGARRGALLQQRAAPSGSGNIAAAAAATEITENVLGEAPTRNVSRETVRAIDITNAAEGRVAYCATTERDANEDQPRKAMGSGQAATGGNPTPLDVAVNVQNIGGVYIGEDNYLQN